MSSDFKQMHALTLAIEVRRLEKTVQEARSILIDEPTDFCGPERAAWLKRVSDFMEKTECATSLGSALWSGLPD